MWRNIIAEVIGRFFLVCAMFLASYGWEYALHGSDNHLLAILLTPFMFALFLVGFAMFIFFPFAQLFAKKDRK